MSPLTKMKSGIALAVIALIALATFAWIETRPSAGIEQLLAKSSVIPGAVQTGFSKVDEQGRTVDEVKMPDGTTEWAVEIDDDSDR